MAHHLHEAAVHPPLDFPLPPTFLRPASFSPSFLPSHRSSQKYIPATDLRPIFRPDICASFNVLVCPLWAGRVARNALCAYLLVGGYCLSSSILPFLHCTLRYLQCSRVILFNQIRQSALVSKINWVDEGVSVFRQVKDPYQTRSHHKLPGTFVDGCICRLRHSTTQIRFNGVAQVFFFSKS